MARYIDPPRGWAYGFPKILPDDVEDVNRWLIEQGYPKKVMDGYGDYFYCRFWNKEDEPISP